MRWTASNKPTKALPMTGLQFRMIGPAAASGRVIAFAVNPKNKSEFYVGVASGGVWKTEEGMRTLKMDGIEKVLQGITDIAQVRAVCIK